MNIKIYSMKACPACERVKDFMNKHQFEFSESVLDVDITRDELKSLFPGTKKVPITIINGVVFRDSDTAVKELMKLLNNEVL